LRLLRTGGQCNLAVSDQFNSWRTHMTNEILSIRVAQAVLAVAATVASGVVLQLAMVIG
jgi:hypothetical protein